AHRQRPAEDGRRVRAAEPGLGDLKGPAAPAEIAVGAADDLREDPSRVAALRDHVTVVAVRREDVVVGGERGGCTRTCGLLSDVEVVVRADLAGLGQSAA